MEELLKNPKIKSQLVKNLSFDLIKNNNRTGVIITTTNDPVEELRKIFNKMLTFGEITEGYYTLQNLFSQVQMFDSDIVINLVVETILEKVKSIKESLFYDDQSIDHINMAMYIQVWEIYRDFSKKMYLILKNYQNNMVEKNIKSGKITCDIFSILQICAFHDSIITTPQTNILSRISNDLSDIDKTNVEQLIDYIDSIRIFMLMQEFTNVNKENLFKVIKHLMAKTSVVNTVSAYMHTLLMKINQNGYKKVEYITGNSTDMEKETVKKVYKIATILSSYAEKPKLLFCHTKFMQCRIIDPKYNNLELEVEIITRMAGLFGREDSQKLIDTITDIVNSRNVNNVIHKSQVVIKKNDYKKINVDSNIINPLVLTKNIWKIYNISELEPNYPTEMKCYLDIINKTYECMFENKYYLEWQPTMGAAQFEVELGNKKVHITSNILQAVAFMYLNDNNKISVKKFSKDVSINEKLAEKILESLCDANLLVNANGNKSEVVYIVNTQNYTGDIKLDIRQMFIDVFGEQPAPEL